ncbi:haloacid dehalogenase [Reticulibacter mediterranei]|uniref:Haloacid dehalogenase n=1 Tax=Reticulibacter mediterranei TaxID=2778369 RepID=A0A8J3IE43_9CHLR|nr:HAD hydrolase-like protein [Reticulibacter mediterranei]GHO90785.1 haloacid dehalogenase [Reticulibacter mediterranei]
MLDISSLLFDLDGTLMNAKPATLKSFTYALQKLGQIVPSIEDLSWCLGPPLRECFATLLNSMDTTLLEQAVVFYREQYAQLYQLESLVYPGVVEALADLKLRGYPMFVVTTQPRVAAYNILHHFELITYFDGIYGSELDGRRSDKRELIKYTLDQEMLSPDKTMMFGDRKYDIVGAKYNRVHAGGITYGYGSIEELTLAGADHLFPHPYDIVHFLAL